MTKAKKAVAVRRSLSETVESGDRRRSLEVLRFTLAESIEAADSANVASLAKQLQAVMAELDGLPAEKVVSPVDVLADRFAARRPATANPSRASKRLKRSG